MLNGSQYSAVETLYGVSHITYPGGGGKLQSDRRSAARRGATSGVGHPRQSPPYCAGELASSSFSITTLIQLSSKVATDSLLPYSVTPHLSPFSPLHLTQHEAEAAQREAT